MSGDITSVTFVSEESLVDLSYLDDDELNDDLAGTLSEMSDKDDSFLVSDEDIFEDDDKQNCEKKEFDFGFRIANYVGWLMWTWFEALLYTCKDQCTCILRRSCTCEDGAINIVDERHQGCRHCQRDR